MLLSHYLLETGNGSPLFKGYTSFFAVFKAFWDLAKIYFSISGCYPCHSTNFQSSLLLPSFPDLSHFSSDATFSMRLPWPETSSGISSHLTLLPSLKDSNLCYSPTVLTLGSLTAKTKIMPPMALARTRYTKYDHTLWKIWQSKKSHSESGTVACACNPSGSGG